MKHFLVVSLLSVVLSCGGYSSDSSGKGQINELVFLRNSYQPEPNKNNITKCYIVSGYINSPPTDSSIKEYVRKSIDTIKGKYDCITLAFYKKSDNTNEAHLKKFPKDLDRYSQRNDLLWQYTWYKNGNVLSGLKFSKGQIIYPFSEGKIRVEDIKK